MRTVEQCRRAGLVARCRINVVHECDSVMGEPSAGFLEMWDKVVVVDDRMDKLDEIESVEVSEAI